MQTRKDLLQAHRLMTQRASQALIVGEPDSPEQPLRRLNIASFCGIMVAVLVGAGFGIIGLLKPGGAKGLDQPGTILIEKETGARYVWCEDGRKLCPVANYTSAKLLAGSQDQGPRTVSRNSLATYDRGPLLGIPGAPDTLPDSKKLVKMPWSACVRAVDSPLQGRISVVTVVAGRDVGGRGLSDDQAVLVEADRQPWLVWRNRRLRVPPGEVTALSSTASLPGVAGKWLNGLPPGADFKPPDIPGGLGREVDGPLGRGRVGQLFTVDNVSGSGTAWYVLLNDGLARISDIEAQLMKVNPQESAAYPGGAVTPQRLSIEQFNAAPKHPGTVTNPELQAKMPQIVPYTDGAPLCATYDDVSGRGTARITIGGRLPDPPQSASGGADHADQVSLPPGRAALAGVLPGPGRASAISSIFLVSEGRRFALQSKEVAQKLGYDLGRDGVPLPAGLMQLIPVGPVLDPAAAQRPFAPAPQPTGTPSPQPSG